MGRTHIELLLVSFKSYKLTKDNEENIYKGAYAVLLRPINSCLSFLGLKDSLPKPSLPQEEAKKQGYNYQKNSWIRTLK